MILNHTKLNNNQSLEFQFLFISPMIISMLLSGNDGINIPLNSNVTSGLVMIAVIKKEKLINSTKAIKLRSNIL